MGYTMPTRTRIPYPTKVLKLSFEVSECKPLREGRLASVPRAVSSRRARFRRGRASRLTRRPLPNSTETNSPHGTDTGTLKYRATRSVANVLAPHVTKMQMLAIVSGRSLRAACAPATSSRSLTAATRTTTTTAAAAAAGRGLHSFTSQLNLSPFHGIGGARRGCVAHVKRVLGGV